MTWILILIYTGMVIETVEMPDELVCMEAAKIRIGQPMDPHWPSELGPAPKVVVAFCAQGVAE